MSHHLDSPLARQDPRLNITDQFVFDGAGATILVMNSRTSLAGTALPAGFHPEGRYEFKIHRGDDAHESTTLRFTFSPEDSAGTQKFTCFRLDGDEAGSDDAEGIMLTSGVTDAEPAQLGSPRVWCGRAVEPFYLDLAQLARVDDAVLHGHDTPFAEQEPAQTTNTFAGATVNSIVVRIPHDDAVAAKGATIRVWAVSKLATDAGKWRPINRAGLPMIWPILRDADTPEASEANQTHPADDAARYSASITALVEGIVSRRRTSSRPRSYADTVAALLTPDTLPYRIGTPATFGFAGFNGRTLADNAPEVMFSLITNSAVPTGLRAAAPGRTCQESFPYVVPVP